MATKNISNIKDKNLKLEKSSNSIDPKVSSQTPSSTLYQKVQDDMLNGKLKLNLSKSQKKGINNPNDLRVDKEELIKSLDIKGMNFTDFYGSPKMQTKNSQISSHTVYNNFSKGRDSRKAEGRTGEKSTERQNKNGHISYDLASNKVTTKPTFKLDLNNRVPKQRWCLILICK